MISLELVLNEGCSIKTAKLFAESVLLLLVQRTEPLNLVVSEDAVETQYSYGLSVSTKAQFSYQELGKSLFSLSRAI